MIYKRIVLASLVLLLALGLIAGIYVTPSLAQDESITITTYYPSPYGSYNELQTNKLAVGDTNSSGGLDADDQPSNNGNIRLRAQAGDPETKTGDFFQGRTGEVAYSSSKDALYHYNDNNVWVREGGSSGIKLVQQGTTDLAINQRDTLVSTTQTIKNAVDLTKAVLLVTSTPSYPYYTPIEGSAYLSANDTITFYGATSVEPITMRFCWQVIEYY